LESGFRTPLLDFFRRGEVARDIRMLAAQGALAPRAHEQLGLLVLLVGDADPAIAGTAEATLSAIPRDSLSAFLARSDVASELKAFFAARGVESAAVAAVDVADPIVDTAADPDSAPEGEDEQTALQRIAGMNVAQRITLAMKGTREERAILIRDPNKIVGAAVLSSPKLTEMEVESIAKMASVSEDTLRIIANTRAWMKNYGVVFGLAKNPKTPIAVSMNLLSRLSDRDLRILSTDRNIPDTLRVTARKKLVIDK
jgi:hypothetical protein